MSVFDGIGKRLGEAAEATASKAKQIAEITKLNAAISSEEKEIDKIYCEIGKIVYEQSKEEATGSLGDMCKKITECKERIEELETKKEQVKNS